MPNKTMTIEDMNVMGMCGLNIFEMSENGRDLIAFKTTVADKHGLALLSELQAEDVALNILKCIHKRRCNRQHFPPPDSSGAGERAK